jgi:PPOX class probable F420-dependent enzyme
VASQDELWELVAGHREGILATIGPSGRAQLSNVLYLVEPAARLVRISTTADRVKAKNLARDPRASLHVAGEDFWHFAVADGTATLSEVASAPNDAAVRELADVHAAFYGEIDQEHFAAEMIAARRLVVRLRINHLYGVLATTGRRPRADSGAPSVE